MEENQVKPRVSKSGYWALLDGKPVFRETTIAKKFDTVLRQWVEIAKIETDKTPEDFGWRKKLEHSIVLKRIIPSLETFEGKQVLFYLQKITYKIRDDAKYHYLLMSNGRIYLRDFHTLSTQECPKNSDAFVVVEKSKTKRIDEDEVLKLAQKGLVSQIFSKVINEPSGQIYGIAV